MVIILMMHLFVLTHSLRFHDDHSFEQSNFLKIEKENTSSHCEICDEYTITTLVNISAFYYSLFASPTYVAKVLQSKKFFSSIFLFKKSARSPPL